MNKSLVEFKRKADSQNSAVYTQMLQKQIRIFQNWNKNINDKKKKNREERKLLLSLQIQNTLEVSVIQKSEYHLS